jgi:hypothetical protein
VLASVGGCSQPAIQSQSNASISIDGQDQGRTTDIRCNQLQSSWFIDLRQVAATARAIVDRAGDKTTVDTVDIRGFGGFTGSYWRDGNDTASATYSNETFTITGTASGFKAGSTKPVSAKFKIVARC